MAVAVLCSGATVVLTLGLMAVVGRELTMVSTALPSLLWVLALSNCIHVLQRYQQQRQREPVDAAVAAAVEEAVRPCTLAALTTALGFVSLVTADMAPVREVGLFAAFGLVISLPVNLVLAPELIRLMGVPARRSVARAGAGWTSRLVLRHPKRVLAAAAVTAVLAAVTLPSIRVESNPLTFLPSDHEVTEAYRFVGDRLAGFYSLEVVVESRSIWTDPSHWPVLEALEDRLASSPVVAKVLGPLDVLRKLRHWRNGFDPEYYELPGSQDEAESLLSGLDDRGRGLLDRLVAEEGHAVRLSAIVNEMDEGRFLELVESARLAVSQLPDGASGWVTGMVLGLVESQQRLVDSQLSSLGLACGVIFLAILVGLRSWRLMLASVPPNLFPVLVMFEAMAVTRIPLDAATVMVASVALGIAVDNTIHLLAGYERHRRAGANPDVAVRATMERVGSALVITSLTAAVGFFSLCLSAFVPIRDFGLLAGVTMLVALTADLFVVPALFVARGRS
jgi:predicted RND superfamily exporter protein